MDRSCLLMCLFLGLSGYAWGCAQFRTPEMVVSEAERMVTVCVMFTEPMDITSSGELVILPSLIVGGAMSPADFTAARVELDVQANQVSDICTDIQINKDIIFEDTEMFSLILLPSANVPLCSSGTTASVSITDSTELTVRFTESVFTSPNEQGSVFVCVEVPENFVFLREISYTLTVIEEESTATRMLDYTFNPPNRVVDSLSLNTPLCDEVVNIMTDFIVETDEFITLMITGSDLNFIGEPARVVINDDDETSLSLNPSSVQVNEGNTGTTNVNFCVTEVSTLVRERDINLILNTVALTATPGDYVELIDVILTIPEGFSQMCQTVTVIGDIIREPPNEAFTVQITPENNNDIINEAFRVTIVEVIVDVIAGCPVLEDPPNGMVDLSMGNLEGNNATYSCMVGFDLIGDSIRACQPSGAWTGEDPTCRIADCGTLPDPTNGGVVLFPSTTFQSVAIYTCNEGFILSTGDLELNRTCQANRVWSLTAPTCGLVVCEPLTAPVNGDLEVMGSMFMSEAVYTCDFGFNLSTGGVSFTRVCQNTAVWSGVVPTCIFLDCGELPDIANGITDQSSGTELSAVTTYTCDPGFTLLGDSTRECGSDEVWTNSEPSCADLTLGIMGSSSGDPISSGDTVLVLADITLSCVIPGIPMDILPGASITWFGPGTEVESMNVGQSSLVLDMIDVQLDDAGTYTCRFTVASDLLEGGGLTVNQDFDLQVQPIDCGQLDDPENGNVNLTGTGFESQAFYTCDNGHILSDGDSERMCMENAMWSGVAPVCDELCVATVQLILDGVDDCEMWQSIAREEKLEDIDSFVVSSIADRCECLFADENVMSSSLLCSDSISSTSVAYRSQLRGFATDDCGSLVGFLGSAVQDNQSISVFNELLTFRAECDINVMPSEDVRCMDDDGLSLGLIIGVAAGGGVIVIIILVFLVVLVVLLVVIVKKRREKKKIDNSQNNVVIVNTTFARDSPQLFPPTTTNYTRVTSTESTPRKIDLGSRPNNRQRDGTFDNTLPPKVPPKKGRPTNGQIELGSLYDRLAVRPGVKR